MLKKLEAVEIEYPHQLLLNQALDFLKEGDNLMTAEMIYRSFLAGSQKVTDFLFERTYEPLQPDSTTEISLLNISQDSDKKTETQNELFRKGLCHLSGIGPFKQSAKKALHFLEAAAKKNYSSAQHVLGEALRCGRLGADLDPEQKNQLAVQYLSAAVNREQPHTGALCSLGQMRQDNQIPTNAPENKKTAEDYFLEASKQKHPIAWFYLGRLKYNAKNYREAESDFQKAAVLGVAQAQSGLGLLYTNKTTRNKEELLELDKSACSWFEKAAEGGSVGALEHLGQMYEHGRAGNHDAPFTERYKEAFKRYQAAADQGGVVGAYCLARLLYERGYTDQAMTYRERQQRAFDGYTQSAAQDFVPAQVALAKMYERNHLGNATMAPRDGNEQACRWYFNAANSTKKSASDTQAISEAKLALKEMHRTGRAFNFIQKQKKTLENATEETLIQHLLASYQPFPEFNLAVAIHFLEPRIQDGRLAAQAFTSLLFDSLQTDNPDANAALIQLAQGEAKKASNNLAEAAEKEAPKAAAESESPAASSSALGLGILLFKQTNTDSDSEDSDSEEELESRSASEKNNGMNNGPYPKSSATA